MQVDDCLCHDIWVGTRVNFAVMLEICNPDFISIG